MTLLSRLQFEWRYHFACCGTTTNFLHLIYKSFTSPSLVARSRGHIVSFLCLQRIDKHSHFTMVASEESSLLPRSDPTSTPNDFGSSDHIWTPMRTPKVLLPQKRSCSPVYPVTPISMPRPRGEHGICVQGPSHSLPSPPRKRLREYLPLTDHQSDTDSDHSMYIDTIIPPTAIAQSTETMLGEYDLLNSHPIFR